MAKKNFDPEKNERENNARAIQDCENAIADGILSIPPKRRAYKAGKRVQYGAHKETYVRESYNEGRYYLIESIGVKPDRHSPPRDTKSIVLWTDLLPYKSNKDTSFAKEERYYLRMLNSPLSSLVSMVHRTHAGVDFIKSHSLTVSLRMLISESLFSCNAVWVTRANSMKFLTANKG